MNKIILIAVVFQFSSFLVYCQNKSDSTRQKLLRSIEYSNPDLLTSPQVMAPGFPSRSSELDVLPGFKNPPPGYGEVPFWWWSGDPLDKDRLLWQIEELHKKGITGMQINYIHRDTPGWPTWSPDPVIFSDKWWEMWKFAADEAGKRSMGIGMSGYTIDWPSSENLFNQIIYSIKDINGRELAVDTIIDVRKGGELVYRLPENYLGVWAYKVENGKIVPGGKSLNSFVNNNNVSWTNHDDDMEIWIYKTITRPGTINPMHPLSGKTVIEKFYQQFEDHTSGQSSSGLNYFFQDELKFGVGDIIWTDDFNEVFRKEKGYDVFEILPGLFKDIGPVTPKARLDFMDVKVRLTEERYFKPIFEWHWSRGKIYGCDPEGRGKEPGMYGDNFQVIRWYTAPGHDTPSGKADLIKGKVSSSIAAIYKRPRVWLEGYHSLGWGATPDQIMFATNENYLYGCNLLNLHGLYYTTHGSFWEWAPPCYHFRMPYWDHMTIFLKYFERLSYLLSQGILQADIAILYPVSPAQAKMNEDEATSTAFRSGTDLFSSGYDFMFLDDQSVTRSEIGNGQLNVSGQSFKILILPQMKVIRWSTLTRALEFYHNGGIVIALGSLPAASDHAGSCDPDLDKVVTDLFGISALQTKPGKTVLSRTDKSGGIALFIADYDQFLDQVRQLVPRHVQSESQVRSMHRKIGQRDVFMVMGAKKGSWCKFRAKGMAERWNPWSGETLPLLEFKETEDGTMVRMPLDSNEAQIIVFTPGKTNIGVVSSGIDEITSVMTSGGKTEVTGFSSTPGKKSVTVVSDGISRNLSGEIESVQTSYVIDGDWEFELKPVMNNHWGDFRLPVTTDTIGVEARIFRYSDAKDEIAGWEQPGFDDSKWARVTYGYGQKFWKLGPLPANINQEDLDRRLAGLKTPEPSIPVIINGENYRWTPYDFSWRLGVEGDPGHEGYHGLKEEVTDEFICLGKPTQGLNETLYKEEKEGSLYYLFTSAYSENRTIAAIDIGGLIPSTVYLNGRKADISGKQITLMKGANPLLIKYDKAGRGHFVLLRDHSSVPSVRTPLSMTWWDMKERIQFDVRSAEKMPAGYYRFTAPPGLKEMKIVACGSIKLWIDGQPQTVNVISKGSPSHYSVKLENPILRNSLVAIKMEQERGNYGGEAFPEPVLIDCEAGIGRPGDWSKGSVLENYSGGAWYRKKIVLTEDQARSRVVLDLGNVVASAEIHVNDSLAAIIVSSPWKTDITKFVKSGENKIEILVYNTLANHYLTIPTKYRGSTQSGLLGPVKLEFYSFVKMN
jgi:hypothetical protein